MEWGLGIHLKKVQLHAEVAEVVTFHGYIPPSKFKN